MTLTKKEPEIVSLEYIFSRISPYDVFRYEIGEFRIGDTIKSPLRKDRTPSFGVYADKNGVLKFSDFADTNSHGDCVQFVKMKYGLTFHEALKKIATSFGLTDSDTRYREITNRWVKPEIVPCAHSLIQVTTRKWDSSAIKYWAAYGIDIDDLKVNEIYNVKDWYLNRQKQIVGSQELCFAYRFPEVEGFKIYYPERTKNNGKWKSNISTSVIEGIDRVTDDVKQVICTKSRKDRIYLSKVLPHITVINTQNETGSGFTDEVIEKLKDKGLIINFDADAAGKKNSMKLTRERGIGRHLNVPDYMVEQGIKDFTDWRKTRGCDDEIIQFLTSKGLIQ